MNGRQRLSKLSHLLVSGEFCGWYIFFQASPPPSAIGNTYKIVLLFIYILKMFSVCGRCCGMHVEVRDSLWELALSVI